VQNITGILKEDVTIDGITHKAGTEITVPVQLGLSEYFKAIRQPEKNKESEGVK